MKNIVIGTAGHIDHGKTSLIKALNGFEGDSTKEEKKRGITIDLSFSSIKNQNTTISFIDVPGHEKLIKNMVAGAFGFDVTMLIIDSKEGVMPQTIEHLEILNLLNIKNIIVVLTKIDLVSLSLIDKNINQIKEIIKNYKNLNLIDIISVSIYDNDSIIKLKNRLFQLPNTEKQQNRLFRYYIDRSFTIKGVGNIVTGTVLDGKISVGDKIFVTSYSKELKIKNLQVHEQDVNIALPSQRTAINLQNSKLKLEKGILLTKKGFIRGFKTVDVAIQTVKNREIKHNSKAIFYIGTKQIETKILILEKNSNLIFAKLEFLEDIYSIYGELFILTQNGRVIAGGKILNPINDPIKKSLKLNLLKFLESQNFISAFEILTNIHKKGFGLISSNQRFGLNHDEALKIAMKIDSIFIDEKELVLYPKSSLELVKKLILDIFNKNQYAFLSPKSIILKIKWASLNLIDTVLKELESNKELLYSNGIYKNRNIKIDNINNFIEKTIFNEIDSKSLTPEAPFNIFDRLDIDRNIGEKSLKKLVSLRKITKLSHNIYISTEKLNKFIKDLLKIIDEVGFIDIKVFREHYPTVSRKYIIAYLEFLDKQSYIVTNGNKRIKTF